MISKSEALKILESIPHGEELIDDMARLYEFIEAVPEWEPIHKRPMTDEEKEEYPDSDGYIVDSKLPDDGDEVLVSYKGQVWEDNYCVDSDGAYFENIDLRDGVAWMPKPPAYKPEEKERWM